jgi:hypothetical protein
MSDRKIADRKMQAAGPSTMVTRVFIAVAIG